MLRLSLSQSSLHGLTRALRLSAFRLDVRFAGALGTVFQLLTELRYLCILSLNLLLDGCNVLSYLLCNGCSCYGVAVDPALQLCCCNGRARKGLGIDRLVEQGRI
jgi:hypothetical protein